MPHDYLHPLVDSLYDTPQQRKFRRLAPMPIGCVFIQWPEMGEQEIREHLRTMKRLGYTNLKGIMLCDPMTPRRMAELAMEEGINPWWYDEGGWEDITPELLEKLGLPRGMNLDKAMQTPEMREYQNGVLRERVRREAEERDAGRQRDKGFLPAEADPNAVAGVVNSPEGTKLLPETVPFFIRWLRQTYNDDLAALRRAWNVDSSSFGGKRKKEWESWEDVAERLKDFPHREFRHLRDILRFKSDVKLDRLRRRVEDNLAFDPQAPMRAGGEISIFLPHVSWGIDMEGYAKIMADGGAFYPSMHPGWHLEEVEFELVRPTFMQASMCADWAKGMWSAPFESSGGPQWWSGGGKVPFVPEVRNLQPAFTFTEGTMAQLLCTYLAAGFRGFGLWCWNPRDAGWEAGEYALCDRNNEPTPRAERVGRIGQAMRKYRREIWRFHKEPMVGLYQDWENDAMWAALATPGRDRYKMEPIKARIGAARALINANIPWEHVTFRQLEHALAPRYRCIYLPAVMCTSARLIEMLTAYVRQGGRVVLDMPGAWLDERGHLVDTAKGSAFEKLFGAVLHEYGYVNNIEQSLDRMPLAGFTAVITPTTAKTIRKYSTGEPAITENKLGKGTAVLLGAALSLNCLKPGNTAAETMLVRTALGKHKPLFSCKGAIVYRMAAPKADHYFLINEGPARKVKLDTGDFACKKVIDAVTGKPVKLNQVELGANDARWLRCE